MIIDKPENIHFQRRGEDKPELPEVRGFLRRESRYKPGYATNITEIREVKFIPGIRLVGFILLTLGGCLAISPADGERPAQLRPLALSAAFVGLAIVLFRREVRYDIIDKDSSRLE